MDIPQAAIDAAMKAADCSCGPDFHEYDCLTPDQDEMRVYLEAAAPHLNGTCALHGDLDQAVILRALSDPGKVVERGEHCEPIAHWQMRAVVASLTRPADPAIPAGGTT